MLPYPTLYRIVGHKVVDDVLDLVPLIVSLQRALVGDKLAAWFDLVSKVSVTTTIYPCSRTRWTMTSAATHGSFLEVSLLCKQHNLWPV